MVWVRYKNHMNTSSEIESHLRTLLNESIEKNIILLNSLTEMVSVLDEYLYKGECELNQLIVAHGKSREVLNIYKDGN